MANHAQLWAALVVGDVHTQSSQQDTTTYLMLLKIELCIRTIIRDFGIVLYCNNATHQENWYCICKRRQHLHIPWSSWGGGGVQLHLGGQDVPQEVVSDLTPPRMCSAALTCCKNPTSPHQNSMSFLIKSVAPHPSKLDEWESQMVTGRRNTNVMIFRNGSRMCTNEFPPQDWKKATSLSRDSFLRRAASTLRWSLSCDKHAASESRAVTAHISSSSKLKYTSKPLCNLSCSLLCRHTHPNYTFILALLMALLAPFQQICPQNDTWNLTDWCSNRWVSTWCSVMHVPCHTEEGEQQIWGENQWQ